MTSETIAKLRAACEGRDDGWPVFYQSDAVTPALNIGHLRALLDAVTRRKCENCIAMEARLETANRIKATLRLEVDRLKEVEKPLRSIVAHYPVGLNPFLDAAYNTARMALAAVETAANLTHWDE